LHQLQSQKLSFSVVFVRQDQCCRAGAASSSIVIGGAEAVTQCRSDIFRIENLSVWQIPMLSQIFTLEKFG
jgi:hypothetical protein